MPSPKRRVRQETNGAVPVTSESPVLPTLSTAPEASAGAAKSSSARPLPAKKHQTDGAYIPMVGPITNVRQIVRGPNVAQGSIESFETLGAYTDHLRGLTLAELHRHAVEDARVVPIDDRDRLIRRLENNWTEVSARERMRQGQSAPKREAFTQEQMEQQAAIRRRLLGARA